MDLKIQGGTATPPPLLSGAPTGEREKEGGGGKKEEEEEKKRDREKEGAAAVSSGTGGAGPSGPGGASGDQSHFSIKESSLSEGNVKLKIGLQAKRTKKPPKILENYVCRPAFRATVRHTGRGGGSARGNRAGATGDGPGSQTQSPSHGREKEKEKGPSVNRPAPSSSATTSAKAPTPPPPAPSTASTIILSPSQVNGSAPAKRGSPKLDCKSDTKLDTKAATTTSERPLNLHRAPPDSKTHPSGKKTPTPQPNPRTSSPSPPLPASKEPSFEGVKPSQYTFSTESQRDKDKGVQNWGAPTVTEKLAQLIATCPPSKTPKPAKPLKIDPAPPVPSSGFMAPTAKQRDRAMANRNTYSRMVHLSPPPPVSRPPGRPYGSRNKDNGMENSPILTPLRKEDTEGAGKASSNSANNISSNSSSRSSSPALTYGNNRLSAMSKDINNDNSNSSISKPQSRPAHCLPHTTSSPSCPISSSSTTTAEQRTVSAVSHLGSPAPSQGHHARDSPALAEESSASEIEQERDSPRDLTKCPPPVGTGKPDGKDKGAGNQSLRGKSSSPSKRSPNRDSSRPGRTSSPPEPVRQRAPSSPELDGEESPQTPLRDDSPDSSLDSPAEQDSKPLKKRRGRKPRWTRVMNKTQCQRAGQDSPFDQSKTTMPLSSSLEMPLPPVKRPVGRPPNPNKVKPNPVPQNPASQLFPTQPKKRGRPKSKMPRLDASTRGCLPNKLAPSKVFSSLLKSKEEQDPPVLHPEVDLNPPKPIPRKRGRPKRLPPTLPQEGQPPTLAPEAGDMGDKRFRSKGNGQLIMKTIIGKINKMKSMKRKRILSQILLGPRTEDIPKGSTSSVVGSAEAATQSLSSLAASFGGKLGPQINVSKKGTIYMGKRRGRKPKAMTNATATAPPEPFLSPNTTSPLHHHQSQHHQLSSSEVFPSPSLSQSSGGLSPISDASFVEPGSVHFVGHSHYSNPHHSHNTFSFPPPTFSAPNPRNPGLGPMSSSMATAASQKKSSCRGYHQHHHYRQHFHYHKLSPPRPLHPTSPAPLSELKEATPSPVSESHSEETVPSDSGIGTDNNSTSDRGEKAGGAGGLGGIGMPPGMGSGLLMPGVIGSAMGPGVGLNSRGRRRHSTVLMEHPSPSPSPHGARSSPDPRRSHPAAPASSLLGHKEKHKHKCKRRSHGCPGYDKLKRQKRKRKKKYLQLRSRRHDPDFLAELDEIVVRLSEIRIAHRTTGHRLGSGIGMAAGTSRGPGVGGRASGGIGGTSGPPPHHYVHRDLLPTIFRVNFGSYYSHPAYSCDPLHYVRKPDMKKKRGRPPKLRESMSEVPFVPGLGFPLSSGGFYHPSYGVPYSSGPLGLGYYRGYPPASTLYPHPHHQSPHTAPSHHSHHSPSFPPPPPTSYMHHHHPSHLLLNPSKFHKKKHKLLRQEYLGGGRSPVLYPPMSSELSFNWHHKHKHRHKHRERCAEEDREEAARGGSGSRASAGISDSGASGKGERVGSLGMAESLQRCRFGRDSSSISASKQAAASSANSPSSSSSSSAERYKRKESSMSCLGPSRLALGSSSKGHHPVESWFRMGSSKADYSKLSRSHVAPGQGPFSDGRAEDPAGCSDSEDEEPLTPMEDVEPGTHDSPNLTNLFASALTRTTLKGGRSRKTEVVTESSSFSRMERPMRKDRSTSAERRELGSSGIQTRGVALSTPEGPDGSLHHRQQQHHHQPSLFHSHGSASSSCLSPTQDCCLDASLPHHSHRVQPSKHSLHHVNKILRAKKLQRQARTGNNVVKKRGPGRPRKYPLPSPPPSPPPVAELNQTRHRGEGVPDATVSLNNQIKVVSKEDGSFRLENMTAGTYTIRVNKELMLFEPITVKIAPNTPQLPDIITAGFSVCGQISISLLPEGMKQQGRYKVTLTHQHQDKTSSRTIDSDPQGAFCFQAKPGDYSVHVSLPEAEVKAGLALQPNALEVSLVDRPLTDLLFTQFMASVSGKVYCLASCDDLSVTLQPVSRQGERRAVALTGSSDILSFSFDNVLPGKYKVSISHEEWCWKLKSVEVDVLDSDVLGVEFRQIGYILRCSLSHAITLEFFQDGSKPENVGVYNLSKGVNRFCLSKPGVYKVTPRSCHQFEQDFYTYDTSAPSILTLTAVRHHMTGLITTDKILDVTVTIKSSIESEPALVLGPLRSLEEQRQEQQLQEIQLRRQERERRAAEEDGGPRDDSPPIQEKAAELTGPFHYEFSYWARAGEKITVTPSSKELLFYPPEVEATITGESCPGRLVDITGRAGLFLEGKVSPELQGVEISITERGAAAPLITVATNEMGAYSVGPLHSNRQYDISANKEGFVLSPVEGTQGDFKAFALAGVTFKIKSEDGNPLSGVLLSLSGGQFRSNLLTQDTGLLTFNNLSPGQYYFKPMMKEFRFEPASQMITVEEGQNLSIDITGIKTAYSCYGAVRSLSGDAERDVAVEAVGQGECSLYSEDTVTDEDGRFRLRGLLPSCKYLIQLRAEGNDHIERALPQHRAIEVGSSDIEGVNIIAFRQINQFDLSGNVHTSPEHLPTLSVKLYKSDNLDNPINSVSLGQSLFFHFPPLDRDGESYVLMLYSTLSRSQYDFTLPQVTFTSSGYHKHVTLTFNPTRKVPDQDVAQGSYIALPLTLLLLLAAYNHEKVIPLLLQVVNRIQGVRSMAQVSGDNAALDEAKRQAKRQKARRT